jgi:hypothetical protein
VCTELSQFIRSRKFSSVEASKHTLRLRAAPLYNFCANSQKLISLVARTFLIFTTIMPREIELLVEFQGNPVQRALLQNS